MVRTKKNDQESTVVKPWGLTQADLESITDIEVAFSTIRLLPDWDIIPEEFRKAYYDKEANVYIQMADAIFCGSDMPKGDVKFNDGFSDDPSAFQRMITSHLRSFEPEYAHKIAGLAYMISIVVTITPEE